jgi:hypothetical protein
MEVHQDFLFLSRLPSPKMQIAPSLLHLSQGLPPEHFVRTRRHRLHAWGLFFLAGTLDDEPREEGEEVGGARVREELGVSTLVLGDLRGASIDVSGIDFIGWAFVFLRVRRRTPKS